MVMVAVTNAVRAAAICVEQAVEVAVSYSSLVEEDVTVCAVLAKIADVLVGSVDAIVVEKAAAEIAETAVAGMAVVEAPLLVLRHVDCIWEG